MIADSLSAVAEHVLEIAGRNPIWDGLVNSFEGQQR
jgi:hypothetical protein